MSEEWEKLYQELTGEPPVEVDEYLTGLRTDIATLISDSLDGHGLEDTDFWAGEPALIDGETIVPIYYRRLDFGHGSIEHVYNLIIRRV